MRLMLKDPKTGGNLILFNGEKEIESFFYKRDHDNKYFTIAWNIGKKQSVTHRWRFPSVYASYNPSNNVQSDLSI